MPTQPKPNPVRKGSETPSPQPWLNPLKLTLAWSGVLLPLGWGIVKTLQKAALLLQI
ncbi:MAG: hypothetical protein RLZZ226_1036 [Pseudomonadota bacterium]